MCRENNIGTASGRGVLLLGALLGLGGRLLGRGLLGRGPAAARVVKLRSRLESVDSFTACVMHTRRARARISSYTSGLYPDARAAMQKFDLGIQEA